MLVNEEHEQKFASYRAFLCYMMAHPEKSYVYGAGLHSSRWDYKTELEGIANMSF